MGFTNIHEVLVVDSAENVYNFYTHSNKIKLIFYNKINGNADKKLIVDSCSEEYDVAISKSDIVYLVCQKTNGSIILLSINKDNQEENILSEEFNTKIKNLNIRIIDEQVHIIYCVESEENSNRLRIYHHILIENEWITYEISDIYMKDILNPISLIEQEGVLIVGYYDLVDGKDQIFINEYDIVNHRWLEKVQLTTDSSAKLYIDMIYYDNNKIDLCYSEDVNGNLVVKYKKYGLSDGKVVQLGEHILSNPANCMYPTFVYSEGMLWIAWIEYDSILSCYSEDKGLSWSLPYLWGNSKKDNFSRYKFITNNRSISNEYILNNAFGTYQDNISFIGFGDIENAIEVPLKSQLKKKTMKQIRTN